MFAQFAKWVPLRGKTAARVGLFARSLHALEDNVVMAGSL
jgi:hypothetical protein